MNVIKPPYGAKKKKTIIGRGPGSGIGKTSGRGHKGQNSRKGGGVRPGFEGGQTPLIRRIPKRGFNNKRFAKNYNEINVYQLNIFNDNEVVDLNKLNEAGLIKDASLKVKILGNGDLTKKITVKADAFSKSAVEKIEKNGGKALLIEEKKEKNKEKIAK